MRPLLNVPLYLMALSRYEISIIDNILEHRTEPAGKHRNEITTYF